MSVDARLILERWLVFYDDNFKRAAIYQSNGDLSSYHHDGFSLRVLRANLEKVLKIKGLPREVLDALAEGLPDIMKEQPKGTCIVWEGGLTGPTKPMRVEKGGVMPEYSSERERLKPQ